MSETSAPEAVVETVLGAVPVSRLGRTLHHEHLWTRNEGPMLQFPHLYDAPAVADLVVEKLEAAKRHGLGALCDATVMGLGRDIRFQQEASRRSGVHVLAATGIYTFDALPAYFAGRSVDAMAECFVHDLRVGVQGTDARAAFLKCATDAPGMTDGVQKVLRAVSAAHRETGAPILTHTCAELRQGIDQLDVFESEGVGPSAVVIGHCGDTDDIEYLRQLLDRGARVGLDRFGQNDRISHERRLRVVVDLCAAGHGAGLVLSQDHSIVRDVAYDEEMLAARRNWHTGFVLEHVLDELVTAGIDGDVVQAMVQDNVYAWLLSSRTGSTTTAASR